MKEEILFLLTGGTIDSFFDPSKDSTAISKKSIIKKYISKLKLHDKFTYKTIIMKDSREITYKDRKTMLEQIKKSKAKKIIITHGTYTMPDTGQFLIDNLPKEKKTIILTGSMFPLSGFEFSDAPFNLGFAIAKSQDLPYGIYICMNGKAFDPKKVNKNRAKAKFEETT